MSQCSPTCLGCFSSLPFLFCLFVCFYKKKKKNCEGCREWSHVTDVGKMRIFHRIAGFILWWIVVYACDQNSSYILVIYFFFLFIFRLLLLWVLAAAFITATVDVSIYVILSSLGRMGKKGCTVWLSSPAALFIIKCKSPWHTLLTSPASFHSSNITDTTTTWVGFSFSSTSSFQNPLSEGFLISSPLEYFLLFFLLFFKASNFNFRGKQEDSKR